MTIRARATTRVPLAAALVGGLVAAVAVVGLSAPRAAAQQAPADTVSDPARDTVSDAARDAARRAEVAEIGPAVDVGGTRPVRTDSNNRETGSDASVSAALPVPRTSRVLDTLDLGTTSITGNQELPKVLYIVPWKRSDLGDLVGRPVNTLLDEVLAPVDPEVFERHLDYYEILYGDSPSGDSPNGQSEEE